MDTVRAFIAIPLLDELAGKIGEVQRKLQTIGADVKWVSKENLHFTLAFLGEVPQTKIEVLKPVLNQALKDRRAFSMGLGKLGAFPNINNPKVIWVGLTEGVEEINALYQRVQESLDNCGFAKDGKPFSPHLTLGRVRSSFQLDKLVNAVKNLQDTSVGKMVADRVMVMQSRLTPRGPIYTPLAIYRLPSC